MKIYKSRPSGVREHSLTLPPLPLHSNQNPPVNTLLNLIDKNPLNQKRGLKVSILD